MVSNSTRRLSSSKNLYNSLPSRSVIIVDCGILVNLFTSKKVTIKNQKTSAVNHRSNNKSSVYNLLDKREPIMNICSEIRNKCYSKFLKIYPKRHLKKEHLIQTLFLFLLNFFKNFIKFLIGPIMNPIHRNNTSYFCCKIDFL